MRSFIVLFAALATVALGSLRGTVLQINVGDNVPYTSCGAGTLHNLTMGVSPDPPVVGQNVTVSANGDLTETVESGNVNLVVSVLGIPVINKNMDICTISPAVTCPIKKNPKWELDVVELIPSIVPAGTYDATANITDQHSNIVACASVKLKIVSA